MSASRRRSIGYRFCKGFKLAFNFGRGIKMGQWLQEQYGITLLTKTKKGMKAQNYSAEQKYLLKRRGVVETIFDQLKNLCQIEHTRHRSEYGFLLNLISGLAAYCLFPYKPQMFGRGGLIGG